MINLLRILSYLFWLQLATSAKINIFILCKRNISVNNIAAISNDEQFLIFVIENV